MVLHGPVGTGVGRRPHMAAGLGRVKLYQELSVSCAAAAKAELPPAKLTWVALPSHLQELQFGVRVAYLVFDRPALH